MTRTNVQTTAFLSGAVAAMLALPVLAQDTGNSASGTENDTAKGTDITCAELTQMDTAVVPGTLYFVAGYRSGVSDSMNLTDRVQSEYPTTNSTSVAGSSDTAATGNATTSGETSMSSTTGTASQSQGTSSTTENNASASNNAEPSAQVRRLSGYFEIPVANVLTVCGKSPERSVSDVVEEQRG